MSFQNGSSKENIVSVKIIKESDLLNFEWSKNVINQVVDNYPHSTLNLDFTPFLLSTSGGNNNILAIFGYRSDNTLQIQFFDINSIANNDLNAFARLNLPENLSRGQRVTSIDWHPEFNESLFVASLTSGVLISVGINLEAKNAQILAQYLMNSKVTSVSWSPKGKQLVVGKANGVLTQLKHTNGTTFQEAKHILPPKDFTCKVAQVKWVLSSVFAVAYVDDENMVALETKYSIVFAPPKKQPVFYDYGEVCLNNCLPTESKQSYKIELCQIGDFILCLSTFSSEVGVIGAEGDASSSPTMWKQFILEDSSRIELPMIIRDESFPRGVSFFRNSTKVFVTSETERYGGEHCPLLIILTSTGILCPYYFINKEKPLSVPAPLASQQLPYNIVPTFSVSPQNTTRVNTEVSKPQKIVSQTTIQASQAGNFKGQNNLISSEVKNYSTSTETQNGKLQDSAQKVEKESKQETEETTFALAIRDEIKDFNKELKSMKEKFSNILKLEIGSVDERQKLIEKTKETEEFLKEIKALQDNLDIDTLQGFVLETFAMAEDGRCRVDRDVDARYKRLLSKRALNPRAARLMKKIQETSKYIEMQLREINNVLDQEWQEKVIKNKVHRGPSDYEIILKLLANNQRTIVTMKSQLEELEAKSKSKSDKALNGEIKKLVNSMAKSKINDSFPEELEEEDSTITVNLISRDKSKKLLDFFDQRTSVPIVRDTVPVDVKSSRFISAVVKAQEKIKELQKKKAASQKNVAITVKKEVQSPKVEKEKSKVKSSEKTSNTNSTIVVTQLPPSSNESMPKTTISAFQTIQSNSIQTTKITQKQPTVKAVVATPKPVFPKVSNVPVPIVSPSTTSVSNVIPASVSIAKPNPKDDTSLKNEKNQAKTNVVAKVSETINITSAQPKAVPTSTNLPFNFSSMEPSSIFGISSKPFSFNTTPTSSQQFPNTSSPAKTSESKISCVIGSSASQQPFKFGLVTENKPFTFKVADGNASETKKYEDITPPTSPNPKSTEEKSEKTPPAQNQFPTSFSFCSLGGKPNPENVNKNPFSGTFGSNTQNSLFGNTNQQNIPPAFVTKDGDASGSFSSGTGVAQSGFGSFQKTPPKFGGFGAAPTFGSSPTFGGSAVFGGSPTFGNSNVFGSFSSPSFQTSAPSFARYLYD
ncbi:nuclear pore complex protein nup214-like protein [Dinothrombium tinctorium]|uniref:Nuclear pore complex protein nup214-like protein n=1 Tax=Dinothrombium tinctorium TaxID=1965070 RepID=A0A3S3S272_9ACAR|nr:nuclear pore complex protein nup214-like protein [Dinothrombium tinctorium]RWS08132.1 nuclear pore complex protein nup214-like protein [Dinothrombium tinctorium]